MSESFHNTLTIMRSTCANSNDYERFLEIVHEKSVEVTDSLAIVQRRSTKLKSEKVDLTEQVLKLNRNIALLTYENGEFKTKQKENGKMLSNHTETVIYFLQ